METYKNKYIKYKFKYLELKNISEQSGGMIKNENILIHISGFPGSGKTTLGTVIKKMFGSKVIVYDTDNFIQHHTKEGKKLLLLEKQITNGNKTIHDYKILWKEIIKNKIEDFTLKYHKKIIIFVGSLDNFAPPNTIYNIDAEYKFLLDVPLDEVMKRYYLRIYLDNQSKSKTKSKEYWKKISEDIYHIASSDYIIKEYKKYNLWHKKNNYKFLSDIQIINQIKTIIKSI